MARPARFTHDDILDGALRVLAAKGRDITIADVGREVGAPSGSIYHRFGSRDDMLTSLWLRSVRRFHIGLLQAYETDTAEEAVVGIARYIPAYCRANPLDSLGMTLYRQSWLLTECPEHLRAEVAHVNDAVDAASRALTRRRYGRTTVRRTEVLRVATRLSPYGLVRPYVGGDVPRWLDDAAGRAAEAIAALGD